MKKLKELETKRKRLKDELVKVEKEIAAFKIDEGREDNGIVFEVKERDKSTYVYNAEIEPIIKQPGWYFWGDTWNKAYGPFKTEQEAIEKLAEHGSSLEVGKLEKKD